MSSIEGSFHATILLINHSLNSTFPKSTTSLANFCTIPLDTAKVRLQLQKKAGVDDGCGFTQIQGLAWKRLRPLLEKKAVSALWKGIVSWSASSVFCMGA
ncbi:Mitochondrial substrate/solute carrier [Sesbania bispinosa]|nr:Mitochondrial substrate/solute carrier [Sesbania bispinosa]